LVYVDIDVEIPKTMEYSSGIVIIPRAEVSIPPVPGLKAYVEFNISRIGNVDNLDMIVTPSIGVTYSF
jgi:hypothetical protein